MRRAFYLAGLVFLLVSCANESNNTVTNADTTATPNTTTHGGAGTGGVGAGFGSGGRAGNDTILPVGADTSGGASRQQ